MTGHRVLIIDDLTGEVLPEGSKSWRRSILEAAFGVAQKDLNQARERHGDEHLHNFRDEWELARRLQSAAIRLGGDDGPEHVGVLA